VLRLHAIRILRSRGMDDAQLQLIYRAVGLVIAKLAMRSSSWWGFTSASDRDARVRCMLCEFSGTTDCKPARSMTYFALRFSQRYDTVPRRGQAFARLAIVSDSTHSYDAARNTATVLTMFRRPPNSLLQLISHCSSEFSSTNITCSSRCCPIRQSTVTNYARAITTDN